MKLWVDDIRLPPSAAWYWAKTRDQAVARLEQGGVTVLSLDHDLGDEQGTGNTGYSVVCWMEENKVFPAQVRLHSANPVGIANMRRALIVMGYAGLPNGYEFWFPVEN